MTTKIQFKKVRSKNFRSFGNQFIEIDLTQKSTLVCSDDNGAGKSTGIVHAIAFVLFDVTYQNRQKKSTLVNSRNNKDCVVEIEFTTKGSEWHVSRGIKPNFLKIIKDGVLIENEASLKDPQKFLEESVLGFNEKVFFNIALLGRDKFVSFAEMSAGETRGFVEVLLDQGIFTSMNDVAKEDLKSTNRQIEDNTVAIREISNKIVASGRVISLLDSKLQEKRRFSNDLVVSVDQEIVAAQLEIESLQLQLTPLESELKLAADAVVAEDRQLAELDKRISDASVSSYRENLNRTKTLVDQFTTKISLLQGQRSAFMSKVSCPACEQPIAESKKHEYCSRVDPELDTLDKNKAILADKLKEAEEVLRTKELARDELQKERNGFRRVADLQRNQVRSKMSEIDSKMNSLRSQIKNCEGRRATLIASSDTSFEEAEMQREKESLAGFNGIAIELETKEKQLYIHRNTIQTLLLLLKDDGVKGTIAKQYLPYINQKTNEYLDALNLWVNIEFDSEFGISMSAPDRKGQEISALSTGQMRRIDLAVLLAWRDIAKLKASVDTNILIMDETLENLSAQGVSEFVEMFGIKCTDTSLFVMTQRNNEFAEFFDRTLHFSLKDGFSVMKEEN